MESFDTIKEEETKRNKFEISIGKNSCLDGGVDELINWANALPDDIEISGNLSHYKTSP